MEQRFTWFVVFLAGWCALMVFIRPEPTSSELRKDWFWAQKTHTDETYQVLALGDSRIYRGFATPVFDRAFPGWKILNLGYSSAGYSEPLYRLAEEKLATCTDCPRVIVLGITPHSLTPQAATNEKLLREQARSPWEQYKRLNVYPFLTLFDPIRLQDVTGSVSERGIGYHERFDAGGWVASVKYPLDSTQALLSYQTVFDGNQLQDTLLLGLETQVKTWVAQGIVVVAVRPASTQAMEYMENERSGWAEVAVRERLEAAGAHWIDSPATGFLSYDGSHLQWEAAEAWTQTLADSVRHIVQPQ